MYRLHVTLGKDDSTLLVRASVGPLPDQIALNADRLAVLYDKTDRMEKGWRIYKPTIKGVQEKG